MDAPSWSGPARPVAPSRDDEYGDEPEPEPPSPSAPAPVHQSRDSEPDSLRSSEPDATPVMAVAAEKLQLAGWLYHKGGTKEKGSKVGSWRKGTRRVRPRPPA